MRGRMWRGFATAVLLCACGVEANGQLMRFGAAGASSGIARGEKFGMRSLVGQASAGIPVNDNLRHGVGFWFADPEIKIPNSTEDTETEPLDLPARFELHQNYPNPFNPTTTIEFDLPVAATVRVEVFNILGQRMAMLVNELRAAGRHKVTWNARDDAGGQASSGVYVYRIVAGDYVRTRTMTLVK